MLYFRFDFNKEDFKGAEHKSVLYGYEAEDRVDYLFDEENEDSIFSDVTKVTDEGAAYKEVPLIITKIYDDQVNEKKKSNKQIDEKVEKLFRQGMNVDDIAAELSCSIAEVQFIIDML